MQSGLESLLWEDLGEIEGFTDKTCETLHAITQMIKEGLVGQPNRQDSKHLNRMVVLTEMMYSEMQQWADELDARRQELAAFNRHNGKH